MMKKLVLFAALLLCSFASCRAYELPEIPERIKSQEGRVDYLCKKYWKGFDFSASSPDEQTVVDFLTLVSMSSEKASLKGIKSFYRKSRPYPESLSEVSEIIEKYLYDKYSPLYDEALFECFLKRDGSPRARYLLDQISNNRAGTKAADFSYFTRDGYRLKLSDNFMKSELLLLIFYDADCENCKAMFEEFAASKSLSSACLTDRLEVLAVDVSAEASQWFQKDQTIPECCDDAMLADNDFFSAGKYLFKAMPALYLLDKDGTVLIKDALIPEIQYFIDNHK